jgi:transmembrane sensor
MLVMVFGALGYFGVSGGSAFRTAVGAVAAVPMSDGSKVTLNTDSQIRISVTGRERRVSLGRGEAFFEVAKDPKRPFVVVAGHCRVVAVGTQFSVWREADEVRVVVTEGRVRVERNDTPTRDDPTTEVSAGSIAHAGDAGVLVEHKRLGEVEETLGWRRGFLFFHDLPLGEAVAEFNRYNRARIVIDSPDIAAIRISGSFRSTNVSGFVHLLRDGFSINVAQRGEQFILGGG